MKVYYDFVVKNVQDHRQFSNFRPPCWWSIRFVNKTLLKHKQKRASQANKDDDRKSEEKRLSDQTGGPTQPGGGPASIQILTLHIVVAVFAGWGTYWTSHFFMSTTSTIFLIGCLLRKLTATVWASGVPNHNHLGTVGEGRNFGQIVPPRRGAPFFKYSQQYDNWGILCKLCTVYGS